MGEDLTKTCVVLTSFETPEEAHMARGFLLEQGIEAFVGETSTSLPWISVWDPRWGASS